MAYERLEPFGEVRADMRAALVCSTMANINRDRKAKAFGVGDFMLDFESRWLRPDRHAEKRKVAEVEHSLRVTAPRGAVTVYEGEAPAVKRLGKRARPNKKLDRILYGEPR